MKKQPDEGTRTYAVVPAKEKRGGPDSAGQSGDTQQMPNVADADSESVEELAEEGNAFEAGVVEGVERSKPPEVSEVTTREVPEDDVPGEYIDDDEHVA